LPDFSRAYKEGHDMKSIAFAALLLSVPSIAEAETPPAYNPVWVPPKLIGHQRQTSCLEVLPLFGAANVTMVHAQFTVVVDPEGSVKSATVRDDSGNADINGALIKCALTWRFVPATIDGKPTEATTETSWSLGH
jgi:TonB family protein